MSSENVEDGNYLKQRLITCGARFLKHPIVVIAAILVLEDRVRMWVNDGANGLHIQWTGTWLVWRSTLYVVKSALCTFTVLWVFHRFYKAKDTNAKAKPVPCLLELLAGLLIGLVQTALSLWICLPAEVWTRPHNIKAEVAGFAAFPLATAVVYFSLVSVKEEALWRGCIHKMLENRWGSTWALLLTALGFGLWHLDLPGHTLKVALEIAMGSGICFSAAFVLTGRLWMPIGLHTGTNLVIVFFFGDEDLPANRLLQADGSISLVRYLISLAIPLAAGLFTVWLARRKGRWKVLSATPHTFDIKAIGPPADVLAAHLNDSADRCVR